MIDFDNRRKRALPKAGNGPDSKLAVGSCKRQFVGFARFPHLVIAESKLKAKLRQQVTRAAELGGRALERVPDEAEDEGEGGGHAGNLRAGARLRSPSPSGNGEPTGAA